MSEADQPPHLETQDGIGATPPPHVRFSEPPPLAVTRGAGFGIRFLARLVDLVFGMIVGLFVGFGIGFVCAILAEFGKLPENWIELIDENSFSNYIFGPIGVFLYHSFAEGIGGTTVGKLVCGLRVVFRDGEPPDLTAGLKRDLAYHWDAFFFGIVGYSRMQESVLRQRYGDAWAGTVVVKNADFKSPTQPSSGRIVLGIAVGITLWMTMTVLDIVLKLL